MITLKMGSFSRLDKLKATLFSGDQVSKRLNRHGLTSKLNSSHFYIPLLVFVLVYNLTEAIWLARFANFFHWASNSLPALSRLHLLPVTVTLAFESLSGVQQLISSVLTTVFVTHIDISALVSTILMLVISSINHRFIQQTNDELKRTLDSVGDDVRVSILVAARNEENNIERCIRSLIDQSYKNYEILVMNDNSTDSTGEILERLKNELDQECEGKLTYYTNDHLPPNWYGKSWSIQCLSKRATGDILILTDADTFHNRDSIKFCVHSLTAHNVDFVSGFPKQNLNTFGSKVLVPSMYIMSDYIIPLWLIESTKNRNISLAIGQLMVVRRSVFDNVGGLSQVSNKICEDLQFARLLKDLDYKTKFISLEDHITCNMYDSFRDAFLGMSKNVFSAIDYSLSKYLYSTIIFGTIIHPLITLVIATSLTQVLLSLLSILIFTYGWIQTLRQHHMAPTTWLYWPFMMLTIFSVSAYSTFVTFCTSGHQWKGRRVQ